MTPGEWIAAAALAVAVLGALFRQGWLIARLQMQVESLPSAIKTERRLTRIETIVTEIARVLHVSPPPAPDEEN